MWGPPVLVRSYGSLEEKQNHWKNQTQTKQTNVLKSLWRKSTIGRRIKRREAKPLEKPKKPKKPKKTCLEKVFGAPT